MMVMMMMMMMVVMTRKCSPIRGRYRRKLRQCWSQIHSYGVWNLVRRLLLLLLKNGWRQRLRYLYCWWRIMTTKGSAIRQRIYSFLESLPFQSACRRSYSILLALPWLWDLQGCPLFCFIFGLLPTLVNDLDVVIKYRCDHGNHVGFDYPRPNSFWTTDTNIDNALKG